MTNILTPGYLRWDGANYVIDPFSPDDRVGPSGPAGSFGGPGTQGPIGPEGPAGDGGLGSTPLSSAFYVDGNVAINSFSNVVSIDFWSDNLSFLSGLSSITEPKLYIGRYITIAGAADPNNNGTFLIAGYFGSGLGIYNPAGSGPDANNGSLTGTITVDSSTIPEGEAASISSFNSFDIATITGLTNMDSSFVGKRIITFNTASPGNKGGFIITAVNSATSVDIYNPNAVAPDVNNGNVFWTFRDGSIQKPFRTIQSAIDSIISPNNSNSSSEFYSIRLLVMPGIYLDDVQITAPYGVNLDIASIMPDPAGHSNNFSSDQVVNIGIGGYTGGIFSSDCGTSPSNIILQDVIMRSPISIVNGIGSLKLVRTNALTYSSSLGGAVIISDVNSTINNPSSTTAYIDDLHFHGAASGAGGVVSYNPFNPGYLFNDQCLLSVYITVTTGSTTGTLSFFAEWSDISGPQSQQMITSLDVTSGGPLYAYANLTIVPFMSSVTYSISTSGVTGPLNYTVDFAIHSLDNHIN